MTVIHELLAVENSLSSDASHVQKDTLSTLQNKRSIFEGFVKSHTVFNEEEQHLQQPNDYKEVVSTVDEQLQFLAKELVKYWDVSLQKEEANQRAFADITIGDRVIAEKVPASVLLSMEKRLTSLIAVYSAIPTLDAAKAWETAEGQKPNVFQTKHSIERFQTVTSDEYVTVVKATDKHPAQVVKQEKKTNIGKYTTTSYSSCLSSEEKAERLQRLTAIIRAVKQARQRANNTTINQELKIGKALLDYVNKG